MGMSLVLLILGSGIVLLLAPLLIQRLGLYPDSDTLLSFSMLLAVSLVVLILPIPLLWVKRFWSFIHYLNRLGWEAEAAEQPVLLYDSGN